jgi:hypothetical protein
MVWVFRDGDGNIAAVYNQPVEGGEEIDPGDPALRDFIQQNVPAAQAADQWIQSDLALSRVLEDLIEVLIEKKIVLFTDFPEGAQKKLRERRHLRKEFSYVDTLFSPEDEMPPGEGQGGGYL